MSVGNQRCFIEPLTISVVVFPQSEIKTLTLESECLVSNSGLIGLPNVFYVGSLSNTITEYTICSIHVVILSGSSRDLCFQIWC